jgi:hypothetical protein
MRDGAAPGSAIVGIALASAVVASGLTFARPVKARGVAIGLHWTRGPGAETCIGPIELARSLEARHGRALFEPAGTAELALEGRVDPDPDQDGYRARIAVVDEQGEELGARELDVPGSDCRALDEALELVISVTLYPDGGLQGSGIVLPQEVGNLLGDALDQLEAHAPAPAATAATQNPPAPVRARHEPPLEARDAEVDRAWDVRVGGAGVLRAGMSPSATLGAQLALGLAPPGWPLIELSAGVLSEDRSDFAVAGSRGSLRVGASRVGLAMCPDALDGALELRGCLGVEALIATAATDGLRADGERTVIVPAVVLGVRGALWLAPSFALGAGAGLALPLRRPDLRVEAQTGQEVSVYAPPVVGAELSAGLIWRATE